MPIWPFKTRSSKPNGPQFQDAALADLSHMFLDYPADPTPGATLRNVSLFDFSVDSLKAMDAHLEQMRGQGLEGRALASFIIRSGAYVGEVIRRNTPDPNKWHWLDYKQAAELMPFVADLGMSIGTAAVLWNGADGVIFPCVRVGKCLENGAEDGTWFYAKVIIADQLPAA